MRRTRWLAVGALVPAVAQAARPSPDRPTVSATGQLVAPHTLELEAGAAWQAQTSVPTMLKYSLGSVEPRLSADLAGASRGAPGLDAGLKIRIWDAPDAAAAILAVSSVPVGQDEVWGGSTRVAVDLSGSGPVGATLNAGVDFAGSQDGGIALVGFPVSAVLSGKIVQSLSAFGEGACTLDGGAGRWIIDAGLGWNLTEILILDASAGWSFSDDSLVLQLGGTVNVGRLGG